MTTTTGIQEVEKLKGTKATTNYPQPPTHHQPTTTNNNNNDESNEMTKPNIATK